MKRMKFHTNVHFIALVTLCILVFTSCKNEADMLQTLNDLKKEFDDLEIDFKNAKIIYSEPL